MTASGFDPKGGWEKYITELERRYCYMDEIAIQAAARLFEVGINVYEFAALKDEAEGSKPFREPRVFSFETVLFSINLLHYEIGEYRHFDLLVPENEYDQWYEWSDKGMAHDDDAAPGRR